MNVTLSGITNTGDNLSLSVQTDNDGNYLFDGIPPGAYSLQFTNLPVDYEFTIAQTGDPETDSDVIFADGSTAMFILEAGDCILDIDAGIFIECINFTDPGEIEGDEYLCGPGNDPGPITEVLPPTGGVGTIEYLWMFHDEDEPFDPGIWTPIPNSNTPSYDPPVIYETTYYARCVRRDGCTLFLESNIIVKEVGDEAVALIEDPGTVCVDEEVLMVGFRQWPWSYVQLGFRCRCGTCYFNGAK